MSKMDESVSTLFISFKDVDGLNFQSAMKMLRNQISWICNEHDYLSDSDKINENDKRSFKVTRYK